MILIVTTLEYNEIIPNNNNTGVCLEDALELHLRACCLETDARTLSLLGATIANGGVWVHVCCLCVLLIFLLFVCIFGIFVVLVVVVVVNAFDDENVFVCVIDCFSVVIIN